MSEKFSNLKTNPSNDIVTSLTDGDEPIREPESGWLPEPDQDRSLESTIIEFAGFSSANGTSDGIEGQKNRADAFHDFESKACQLGVLFDGFQPDLEGGREHDLIFDNVSGTVLKFTKPSQAAYVVRFDSGHPKIASASPLEYLERQSLHNRILADDIRFVGVGGDTNNRRIITRQQHIKGRAASWEQILRLMVEELGFKKLRHNFGIGYEDSYGFIRGDVAIFDMRPPNVIMTESGIVIPIDSIPVQLTDSTRQMFNN